MKPVELLRLQSVEWGIRLRDAQVEILERYAELLAEYDKARVIGARDFSEILLGHVLDSLSCLLVPSLAAAETLADVGSGGGLPGMPIRISRPQIQMTLVESVEKKARFIEQAVRELGLHGAEVVRARAEDYGRREHGRGKHQAAVTRAVASLPVVIEYCVPLVAVGGVAVAMKGRVRDEEFEAGRRAARLLGARVVDVVRVPFIPELPDKERHLVVVEKEQETPEQYPRRAGRPAKRPLGDE